nr:hypothetical protein [Moraxellaceae bacterium]
MEFTLKLSAPVTEKTGVVIVAQSVSELSPSARALDTASDGQLVRALKTAGFEGKPGQSQLLPALPGIMADAVLVVGTGDLKDLDSRGLQRAALTATKALASGPKKAVSYLAELPIANTSLSDRLTAITRASGEAAYRFDTFKSKKNGNKG